MRESIQMEERGREGGGTLQLSEGARRGNELLSWQVCLLPSSHTMGLEETDRPVNQYLSPVMVQLVAENSHAFHPVLSCFCLKMVFSHCLGNPAAFPTVPLNGKEQMSGPRLSVTLSCPKRRYSDIGV